jgi:NAD+ kinase
MMKVAIYSRGLDLEQESSFKYLLQELSRHQIQIIVYRQLVEIYNIPESIKLNLEIFENAAELDQSINCLISLGGDGTMLDAVTLVKEKGIPLLGVNFGRLGFE